MLVLSRKKNEEIYIGPDIVITVVEIDGNRVKLGLKAPKSVRILRTELIDWKEGTLEEIPKTCVLDVEFDESQLGPNDTVHLNLCDKETETVDAESLDEIIDQDFPTPSSDDSQESSVLSDPETFPTLEDASSLS